MQNEKNAVEKVVITVNILEMSCTIKEKDNENRRADGVGDEFGW
jgi:hypothetical protein